MDSRAAADASETPKGSRGLVVRRRKLNVGG